MAIECPAFELMYGGSKGGGKTDFLVMCPIRQIVEAHRAWLETGRKQRGRAIIFRKNLKNLADITTRCLDLYPLVDPAMGIGGWSKMERRWTFSSGYVVDLAHLDGPEDHLGYNGQEITALLVDQAEEISEEVINFLIMQVRSGNDRMRPLLIVRYTANPGGKHGTWVKKRFIDSCPPGKIVSEYVDLRGGAKREVTRAFVPAKLWDNKYLAADGSYEANLRRLPDHLQRMYLDGDWNVVVGAFFSHVFEHRTHVIKSFPIPASQPVKMGIDWGSTAPACCLWGTRDADGNVYVIDELYGPGVTGRTFGEKMLGKFERQKWSAGKKYSREEVYGLLDRGARAKMGADGTASSPAAGIAQKGFRIFDANKERIAGIEQITERLLKKPDGKPSLYIFGDRCPNLVRTLPILMPDAHNPEDLDTDQEDHPYDALRYLCMDWPIMTKREEKSADNDVERWLRLGRERRSRAQQMTEDYTSTGYGD